MAGTFRVEINPSPDCAGIIEFKKQKLNADIKPQFDPDDPKSHNKFLADQIVGLETTKGALPFTLEQLKAQDVYADEWALVTYAYTSGITRPLDREYIEKKLKVLDS